MRAARIVIWAILAAAPLFSVPSAGAAGRAAPGPATFLVGAAVRDIDPQVPVYAGGFGMSPPITRVDGPLQVRALYISNGHRAVAFAIVDSQAYFTAYQEGPDLGITSVRQLASAAMSRHGPAMTSADIIVQGSHSHSAPTLEGIWGPVPLSYLRRVHDQTVAALIAAERSARVAQLQWARTNAPELDNSSTAQYDSFPGWTQDGQLSVLRAVSPRSGATIATFVNVPAHPDIVCGACLRTLTADYFGAVRSTLDGRLGGTTLVTPSTLGREETPVQGTGIGEMQWFARVVAALSGEALAHAEWIRNPRLASAESAAQVPGANPALLALVEANHLPDAAKQQFASSSGEYPIDRADTPPYLSGNVIGTSLTALRVGPLAYLSMPGEPFPEVRLTLSAATKGAAMIVALSKGQDDLGYFYPAWVYPFTEVYPTDQGTFNVAPQAGDQIIEGQLSNLHSLGFSTAPLAVPAPLPTDYGAALRPGIQALASPPLGLARPGGRLPVTLQAIYAPADQNGSPLGGKVHWSFGDGTVADTGALSFGGPCGSLSVDDTGLTNCPQSGPAYVQHAFTIGTHRVTVSGHDTTGNPVSYSLMVRVFPPLRMSWRILRRHGSLVTLRAIPRGGSGRLLSIRWRFRDGSTASGLEVVRRFRSVRRLGRVVVTAVDAAAVGN